MMQDDLITITHDYNDSIRTMNQHLETAHEELGDLDLLPVTSGEWISVQYDAG